MKRNVNTYSAVMTDLRRTGSDAHENLKGNLLCGMDYLAFMYRVSVLSITGPTIN